MSTTDQIPTAAAQAAIDQLNQLRAERDERGNTNAPQTTILMEVQALATLAVVEAITGLRQSVAAQNRALVDISDALNAIRRG